MKTRHKGDTFVFIFWLWLSWATSDACAPLFFEIEETPKVTIGNFPRKLRDDGKVIPLGPKIALIRPRQDATLKRL